MPSPTAGQTDFAFVHINKTAGSSIERALGLPFRHRTALELIEELGREEWRRRFTFTVVRNPWDKVVSHYAYRVRTDQTALGDRHLSFAEWVRETYGRRNPAYYDNPKMFMPQVDWISDREGQVLVNFVARFESLERDFATICTRLGRECRLPHLKRSRRGDYHAFYDDESRQTVAAWFDKDLREFAYRY
jgi:hypothetical protein